MKENRLWKLFISTFTLSACTFGGGFVIVSLYKKKFVEELNWLDEDEMLDITAIAQSSPGPIPVNASVILGYRIHGVLGSIVAILGTIIPPFVIISLISIFYNEFKNNQVVAVALQVMRAGVAAVILDVVVNLGKNIVNTKNMLYITVMAAAFIATYFFNLGAIYIIFACLGIGLFKVLLDCRKEKINGTSMDSIH
ncbi:chromate transporter [Clostridium polynesiense]|uniref:chromate transporter n=1 Tax=Clostridium polynesiense TaxID=1325933 RepID=UPI00058E4791|nr:chromate transporter [Clostridium polynesiense]